MRSRDRRTKGPSHCPIGQPLVPEWILHRTLSLSASAATLVAAEPVTIGAGVYKRVAGSAQTDDVSPRVHGSLHGHTTLARQPLADGVRALDLLALQRHVGNAAVATVIRRAGQAEACRSPQVTEPVAGGGAEVDGQVSIGGTRAAMDMVVPAGAPWRRFDLERRVAQPRLAPPGTRTPPSIQRDSEHKPLDSLDPRRADAKAFIGKYKELIGYDTSGMSDGLVAHLEKPVKDYVFVRAVIDELPSSVEDNVSADLVNRLPMPVSVIGLSGEGRAMLDVLYEAMITGNVSKYERQQADKIVSYRMGRTSQSAFLQGMTHRKIFPIRNIGVTRLATATFKAELLANGKVKVWYSSVAVTQDDMFKEDLKTLPGWSQLSTGIELDADEVVAVRLWDDDPTRPIDVPALALIDYSNQIKQRTLSTAASAFLLGLTLGAGALGGGVIRGLQARVAAGEASKAALWGARALIWADRVQYGIQAGAMIINDHRDWIVKTFPDAGPALLDAVDTANRVAGYYGWARLGVDGLRFVSGKLRPAAEAWRAAPARATLGAKEASIARGVEDEADTLLAELQYAEESKAAESNRGAAAATKPGETRRVVAGGDKEIHVSNDRVEICPIQRCPDLRDTVGTAIADKKVADEVGEAEKAAKAGNGALAADKAEAAMRDAERTKTPASTKGKSAPRSTPVGPPNASDIAAKGYPLGFKSLDQFKYFGQSSKGLLNTRGYPNAEVGVQGSSVTGYSASGSGPFDAGRISDLDVAVVSPKLFEDAKAAGVAVRDGHTRFALTPENAATLKVGDLAGRMANFADGRKVNLMIFESRQAALNKEPMTMWAWW